MVRLLRASLGVMFNRHGFKGVPLFLTFLTVGLFVGSGFALADALVDVEVRGISEEAGGQVNIRSRDGKRSRSCAVQARRCQISGVPGGSYRVTFTPSGGSPTAPQSVMVPPSGTVRLVVSGS